MRESNHQVMAPSVPATNGNSSSKIEKARNLFRVLKNPPQPHMCIQDFHDKSCKPCFINVLSWSKLSTPVNPLDPIPLYGGMKVINQSSNALKFTISGYSQESEITEHPDVFAVMAHPEVLRVSGKTCTDVKDRDAFIDLMLDFIEAMNPGVKFRRKFVVLGDRDLAGELKDIWNTVHNKRQKDKMSQSFHGEGDISYFNNRHSSSGTTVRISKQTTKNMAELSVKDLCSAVDVTLVDSSSPSSHKPNSWLFNGHSHERSSSDSSSSFRDETCNVQVVGHENSSVSGVSCPTQSMFPLTLNTSVSSSSPEIPPTFPCFDKKAIKEDSRVEQTFQHVTSPQATCAEPLREMFPSNISENAVSLHRNSEVPIPLNDDLEDKPHFKFAVHKTKSDESKNILFANVTGTEGSEKCKKSSAESNQPSSQSVVMMCDDSVQRDPTYQHLPVIIQSNQSMVSPPDDLEQCVAIHEHQVMSPTNQHVATVCETAIHPVAVKQDPVELSDDQPVLKMFEDIVHADVACALHSAVSPDNQPAVTTFEEIVSPAVVHQHHPVTPQIFQPAVATLKKVEHTDAEYEPLAHPPVAIVTKHVVHADTSPGSQPVVTFRDVVDNNNTFQQQPVAFSCTRSTTDVVISGDAAQGAVTYGEPSITPGCDQPGLIPWEERDATYKQLVVEETQSPVTKSSVSAPDLLDGTPLDQSNVELTAGNTKKNCDSLKPVLKSVPLMSEESSGKEGEQETSDRLNKNSDLPFVAENADVEDVVTAQSRTCSLNHDTLNETLKNKTNSPLRSPVCSTINLRADNEEDKTTVFRLDVSDHVADEALNMHTVESLLVNVPTTVGYTVPYECVNSLLEIAQSDQLLESKASICSEQINRVEMIGSTLAGGTCSTQIPVVDDVCSCNNIVDKDQTGWCAKCISKTSSISAANRLLQEVLKAPSTSCDNSIVLSPRIVKHKSSKNTLGTASVTNETMLPIIATSCFKPGRKIASGDIRSTKETLPHPSVVTKTATTAAVVSEKPKSKTSAQKQSSPLNGLGFIGSHSPSKSMLLTNRSPNVAVRLKHQGTQKPTHASPTAVTNTTILQSFGVLVPKENTPRRTDRKRNSKLSEMSAKPLVDTTFLPFSACLPKGSSEVKIDRYINKNAVKAYTPVDNLKSKPRPACDKHCRMLRRSLSENNQTDKSTNLVTNVNLTESSKVHSARQDSQSRGVSPSEAGQHVSTNDTFATTPRKFTKAKSGKNTVGTTDLHEKTVTNKRAARGCPVSRSTGHLDCKAKNNAAGTLAEASNITNVGKFEAGPHSEVQVAIRGDQENSTPQCCEIVAEPTSLNESQDKRLLASEGHQRSKEPISIDSCKQLSHNEILAIENICPQPKTEIQSHQDNVHCMPETVCLDSIAHSSLSL